MPTLSRRSLARGFLSLRATKGHAYATRALAAAAITQKKVRELDLILHEIRRALLQQTNTLHATVTSAHAVPEIVETSLIKLLKQKSGATTIQLDYTIDPSLKGGLVITSPHSIIDSSTKRQLSILKRLF